MKDGAAKLVHELDHTDEVVGRAVRACEELLANETTSKVPTKATFLEAFATIQRREEDRRKSSKQEARNKQKKNLNEANPQFRGTKIGVDQEVSAFWMVMEVLLNLNFKSA
jgi:predicted Ser/Thr protein kinase